MIYYDDPRKAYLARVASLYYDQGKSQQEIADELGITRSAISRLLTEARNRGIVEIIVHYPWRTDVELEETLQRKFNLKKVRVLLRENKSHEDLLQGLGVLAGEYFNEVLRPGMTVGISWGTALFHMIKNLRPTLIPDLELVQLIGATGSENNPTDGPVLAQLLADRLGTICHYLHAPLIVDSETGHKALLQERTIQATLERARKADIALVGIGTTHPELSSLLRSGYLSHHEMEEIRQSGAVGDICAYHYDGSGHVLDIGVNRRVIGVDLDNLSKMDTVIGVAGDERKGETILAALRGGFINALITDNQAARRILELAEKSPESTAASPVLN